MFTKTKESDGATTAAPAQEPVKSTSSRPAPRSPGSAASIICADMQINGSMASEGALQIDGLVDGDVSAAEITIGSSGKVIGEVKADAVRVKGEVRGSIRARKIELETGAKVEGDILHASLSIQPNALFEGQVKHDDDPLKDAGPKAASASKEDKAPTKAATSGPSANGAAKQDTASTSASYSSGSSTAS